MKSLWNNFKVAFAMFSKIPMPRADWTKENMKYMFCFFPFIGTVIGGLTMLVAYLGLRFGYQPGFVTAVLVLVPVFVTGGIHVDGLLDTSDALSSWQERSRRLEILKDSHAGAFAVITAAVYFIAWYGAYSQLFNSAENMRAIGILSHKHGIRLLKLRFFPVHISRKSLTVRNRQHKSFLFGNTDIPCNLIRSHFYILESFFTQLHSFFLNPLHRLTHNP